MKKPILGLIPSAYQGGVIYGKVYSILPVNGDGDFLFLRNSNATRVKENGLIENVDNNVPRLDWLNSNCPSLLLEPQRTNLALYSENFEGTNWSAGNTVITQNDSIAPSGEQTAIKLQRTSTSASYRTHFIYKSASAITYTTSVFVKQGEDNYFAMRSQGSYPSRVDIRFRFDTGLIYYAQATSGFTLIDYNVENYSNGWYRIYFTYTSDTNTTLSLTFSPRETDGNIDSSDTSSTSFAYVWGFQTEVGNYLTSYIKTEGSAITRFNDQCLNGGNGNLFDITEGTFFVDVTPYKGGVYHYISLNSGNNQNRIIFIFNNTNTSYTARVVSSGSTQLNDTRTITFETRNKIAISLKQNDVKIFLNGIEVASFTNFIMPNDLDRLSFAIYASTDNFFQGKVHDTRVYDRVLTEAELIELTTL